MTIADFLSDRLGRIVLQGGCAAASALFLLATGTQPGVVALLLMGLILVFVLAQLWECVRLRRRLAELKAIMEGLDQKQLFAECAPKPEGLWERELFALMHGRKPPMDVRPHLPLPSSAFGQTAWCSLTKETATWLVSVLPKPSTP